MNEVRAILHYGAKLLARPRWLVGIGPDAVMLRDFDAALPTLICLHGYLHNATLFTDEPWLAELPYNVIIMNTPSDVVRAAELVQGVWEWCATKHSATDFALLGHSFGGIVALWHQARYGQFAKRVICVATPLYGTKVPGLFVPTDVRHDSFVLMRLRQQNWTNVTFLEAEHDAIVHKLPEEMRSTIVRDTGHLSVMKDLFTKRFIRANL
jgi:pimeloyl-ACP methyl ester carboxylesterase